MKVIQAAARDHAPTGATSMVKQNIKIRAGKRKKDRIAINVQIGEGDFQGKEFYGAFPEYGTKGSGRGAKDHKGGQPAQHFMQRAFEEKGQDALDLMMREIKDGIEKQAKG